MLWFFIWISGLTPASAAANHCHRLLRMPYGVSVVDYPLSKLDIGYREVGPFHFNRDKAAIYFHGKLIRMGGHFSAGHLFWRLLERADLGARDRWVWFSGPHFQHVRNLARLFQAIDPHFNSLRYVPAVGYSLVFDDTDPKTLYGPFHYKDLTLDWLNQKLHVAGEGTIPLTPVLAELMKSLMLAQGEPVSLEDLSRHVTPEITLFNIHLLRIRQHLSDLRARLIYNHRVKIADSKKATVRLRVTELPPQDETAAVVR